MFKTNKTLNIDYSLIHRGIVGVRLFTTHVHPIDEYWDGLKIEIPVNELYNLLKLQAKNYISDSQFRLKLLKHHVNGDDPEIQEKYFKLGTSYIGY